MNSILETRALTKFFRSCLALDTVTLSLPRGRIAGLLGRNGSGKTTLLHHAVGLLLPTSGECLMFGCPAAELGAEQLGRIGFVPQTPRFLEWMTGEEYLRHTGTFYSRWDEKRMRELVGALDFDSVNKIATLTPGDRQKLAFINAVCHHPELLILDEPSSALDPIVRERFLTLLVQLARDDGATIVISSHLLHDVEKVVDWVTCLDFGRLVSHGPLDELQESYAEWIVTARDGALPARFPEPYVLFQEGDSRRARLQVRGAAGHEVDFGRRYGVEIASRPLSLEQLFPLLVNRPITS